MKRQASFMRRGQDERTFRLFYAAEDTVQPCVPATAALIPRVAEQHLRTPQDRERFYRFVADARNGDLFHLTGKPGAEGILIVCTDRSQLPDQTRVGDFRPIELTERQAAMVARLEKGPIWRSDLDKLTRGEKTTLASLHRKGVILRQAEGGDVEWSLPSFLKLVAGYTHP